MSILDKILRRSDPKEPESVQNVAQVPVPQITRGSALWDSFADSSSGGLPTPTESTAWSISAVTACVNLIAGAIASLPLHVYNRDREGNRTRRFDDPLWWVFNEQFTPRWSAAAGWQYLITARLFHGDAFAQILRNNMGEVVGLVPLHPQRVTVAPWPDGSRLAYAIAPDETLLPAHRNAQQTIVLDQDDVLHISGAGFDGCRSPSPLRNMLRMSGSVALATQEYAARFFANGARPDYALQTDATLSPEAVENLRTQIDEKHGGVAKAHRPMLLQGGLKAQALQLPVEDLQLLETRQFQIEEIARCYGVPPFMIGHNEKTTSWGSGVESMGAAFVRYTLASHLTAIHNEVNRKCFRTFAKVAEFDTWELERADIKTLMESFRTAIGRAGEPGFLSINEVRAYLNRAPIDGGDEINKGTQPGGENAQKPV
jgi:HK97 family phage portal protein